MSDAQSSAGDTLAAPDPKLGHAEDPRQLGLFSVARCGRCGCTPEKPCGRGDAIGPDPLCTFCHSKGATL